jgi:hypothetical protein
MARRHRPLTLEQKAEIEAYLKAQAEGRLPTFVSDGPSRHAKHMATDDQGEQLNPCRSAHNARASEE